jgi:hypothetical protein
MLSNSVRKLYDSTVFRVIFMASALASLLAFAIALRPQSHADRAPAQDDAASQVLSTLPAQAKKSATQLPAKRIVLQTSSGDQNPNVSHAQGDVAIRYGSTEKTKDRATQSAHATERTPEPASGSVIQISHGLQDPNISDVGGNVSIDYGAPTPANQEVPK